MSETWKFTLCMIAGVSLVMGLVVWVSNAEVTKKRCDAAMAFAHSPADSLAMLRVLSECRP